MSIISEITSFNVRVLSGDNRRFEVMLREADIKFGYNKDGEFIIPLSGLTTQQKILLVSILPKGNLFEQFHGGTL